MLKFLESYPHECPVVQFLIYPKVFYDIDWFRPKSQARFEFSICNGL